VRDHDHIWAIGDTALIPDVKRGGFVPPTAQYAIRAGRRGARNVLAAIRGKPTKPFVFGGLGQLAVVGHRSGVAQVMGLNFSGLLAWVFWRSVYWMKLPGARAKLRVGLDWTIDLFFPRDITKLEVQRTQRLRRAHYRAGEEIVRQGELGDRFFIIESGEVEVVHRGDDDVERRLCVQSAGESFGELALLENKPRSATVRCLTPVDVLSFARDDFTALVASYAALRDHVARDVDRRERTDGTTVV
jgi:NADH dehydrogenase